MIKNLKVIAFDADDTLWNNEPYFQDAQTRFGEIMSEWIAAEDVVEEHYKTEINNLPLYGFGIKGFILSLLETALRISNHKVSPHQIEQIIQLGKSMLSYPVELLPGVQSTLEALAPHYRLIVATKGDLLDQERKLKRSGISNFFHHVEVMSDKTPDTYQKLLNHLDIQASEFLMIGNAIKSDIIPVLELGGNAIHIPYAIDWIHEKVETFEAPKDRFKSFQTIAEIPSLLLS